jgi:hypothetical protein
MMPARVSPGELDGALAPDLVLTNDPTLRALKVAGDTAYMGFLRDLLEWNVEDPVDNRERVRNEIVDASQWNRNPFVDHPEWVDVVFGRPQTVRAILPAAGVGERQ